MAGHAYRAGLHSRFRGLTERSGLLLRGPAGWGEFSPFAEYSDDVALPWLRAALEAAVRGYPAPLHAAIPVNVTVPAVGPERAAEIVAAAGCSTAKVKVAEPGQSLAQEQARLEAVRAVLPHGHIRIDVNGLWSVEQALAAIPLLDAAAGGLQYVEQPCATVEELAEVRRKVNVPIAADESIRRAEDPLRVVELEAADVAVVKVAPLGGVRAALHLIEQLPLPVVVSSALESSVGIAAGIALAAVLPSGTDYAHGLATLQLFDRDVAAAPLVPEGGVIPVRAVQPDSERYWNAPPELTDWWIARARRVGELLPSAERDALAEVLA